MPCTFARLTDASVRDHHGLLALRNDAPVGLAHYIFHRHGWHVADVCYLQDLFVAPEARGDGVGRALIEAVYAEADAAGAAGRLLADPGVQRHRPAALRPDRTRHAVREVRALSRRMRSRLLAAIGLAGLAACAGTPPRGSRDQLGPLRRGHAAEGRGALEPGAGGGLHRSHLRARERREARAAAALRAAGAGLPGLGRARGLSPRPRAAAGAAARRGRARHRRDRRALGGADLRRGGAGRADHPDLPDRGLLHRAGRERLARLHAAPARGAAALARPGDARARRDLPAARHHAAGRARLPERGDHPGARPGRRPLPAARHGLERRQLPRHGDALRHADAQDALPARAPQRHVARRGDGGAAGRAGPDQSRGAGAAAGLARARVAGLERGDRGRALARGAAVDAARPRRSRRRGSPRRCARSTTGSASRC